MSALRPVPDETVTAHVPPASEERAGIWTVTLENLLEMEIPPRPKLLDPILPEKGLGMIFATRGVGKTYLALSIAYAVASGSSFLHWRAPEPRRVVYIDGEMPLPMLKERLENIVLGAEREANTDFFKLIPADLFASGIPNLSRRESQEMIEPLLDDAALVVLDNISTLAASDRDNDADSWSAMQDWLLRLRRKGTSVLLVHHAGKGGAQRGTSRHEDVLDISIELRRPDGYVPSEGARFEIHFAKARGLFGRDVEPFEVRMEVRESEGLSWTSRPVDNGPVDTIKDFVRQGLSVRAVAKKTGVSKSTVSRVRQRLADDDGANDAAE